MTDKESELIKTRTSTEISLDIMATISSIAPWIGGPVSNVLSGISIGRKFKRISEVLEGFASDMKDSKSKVSEEYVRKEEFEDLLEQTLKRVVDERNVVKRKIYRAFLTDAVKNPGEDYDEQIRILRALEHLQLNHILVLKALLQEPDPNPLNMGSPNQTLKRRLPEMDEHQIGEMVTQLNDLRITNMGNLKVMMTGHGAENLEHSITAYGKRFLKYILEE